MTGRQATYKRKEVNKSFSREFSQRSFVREIINRSFKRKKEVSNEGR